jgi:YVTN family beta-propeller protein
MRRFRAGAGTCAALLLAGVVAAGCSSGSKKDSSGDSDMPGMGKPPAAPASRVPLPPPDTTADALDVYSRDRPGMFSPAVQGQRNLVYVPDTQSNDVQVIDPSTYKVIDRFKVGAVPQHVVPSWDLKTLWVNDNNSNDLIPIDPMTGKPGQKVEVDDPYNLYFTPDGKYAIVMAERNQRLDFRDPHTMQLVKSVNVPCRGPNHADFSADGTFFIVACEFSGNVVKLDTADQKVDNMIMLAPSAGPQDVKLAPDGSVFYIADMNSNGVWVIDAAQFKEIGFIPTGRGAHGLYPSRDSKTLYVSNRGEGSISLISFASRRVEKKWKLPGGGSPDMGGVSADGKVLWLSGRYDGEVYAISTDDGHLIKKIHVGAGPHGVCVWPQPGRFSLGHTGVLR